LLKTAVIWVHLFIGKIAYESKPSFQYASVLAYKCILLSLGFNIIVGVNSWLFDPF